MASLNSSSSMSNVSDVMSQLGQITECSICTETFQDPRVLPCIHTYCLRCLQGHGDRLGLGPGDKMPCPLCRDEYLIPESGLSGLRKNFFMSNLIEMSLIAKPVDRDKLCEICMDSGEDSAPEATMYCVECRQNLCDHCAKEHKRQRLSRHHQILQRGHPLNEDAAKLFGPTFCEFHSGRPADLYCTDCKGILCMMCFAESHHSHQCTDISKMGDKFRGLLGKDIDEVTGCLGEVQGMKLMLEKKRKRFLEEVEEVKGNVVKRSEELRETLERHTKSLLDELASLEAISLDEFRKNMEEMERHLKTLETFKSYCEEMKSKGSPSDVCRSITDLQKRTLELKDMHAVQVKRPICCLDVSFRITQNQDYINSYPNMVGVVTGTASKLQQKALITNNRPVTTSRLTKRLDLADRNVTGVACLDHRLYILLTDGIRVFEDLEPFNRIAELSIPGMKSLVDIAACQNFMCLYVTDRERSCVWRLDVDHKASVVIQNIANPYTLSVSGEGNIVTVRWGHPSSVEIYGTDAILMYMVPLDPTVTLPYHAVQTSTGNIILSHGGKGSHTHRVLELSLEGVVLRSYPPQERPDGKGNLNCPLHLALDTDDRVFVADNYNGLVILLRQQLELDRLLVVEARDGVRRPSRLCYLSDRKMLFLVNGNKSVDVYTLDEAETSGGTPSRSESVEFVKTPVTALSQLDLSIGITRQKSSPQNVTTTRIGRFV